MALNTSLDIVTEVLIRSQQNTSTGFLNDTILNDWLTEKHRWAASYKKWPFTEGRVSTTFASALTTDEDGEFRGEFPEGWKAESIRWMWIGGKRIQKMNFQSYRRFREDQPSADDRVFTDYGRLYYVNPNIDVSGTIVMWGQFVPTPTAFDFTDDTQTTIFSNVDEDGNEAIVEAMLGALYRRSNKPQESQLHYQRASELLDSVWQKMREEQFGYHTGEPGMFESLDVLGGGMKEELVNPRRWL